MIVNIAVTELVFGLVLVGGILLWWPDVPWTALTVAAVAINAVVPIVFYPWSKTVWMALDVALHGFKVTEPEGPVPGVEPRSPVGRGPSGRPGEPGPGPRPHAR
jgi:hypothetical protein